MGVGVVVAILAMLGAAPRARSAEDEPPCLRDVERFCAMVPDTGGFLQDCLGQHLDELAPECRNHLSTATAREELVRDECRSDADRFCADVGLSGGKQMACLLRHREQVSPRCREAMDDATPERAAVDESPADGARGGEVAPEGADAKATAPEKTTPDEAPAGAPAPNAAPPDQGSR